MQWQWLRQLTVALKERDTNALPHLAPSFCFGRGEVVLLCRDVGEGCRVDNG